MLLHDNLMTCGATYSLYIHTVANGPINTLSYIRGVDFDSGQTIRVENFNGIHFVGNDIRGPVTMTLDSGVEFMSNYFDCGSNTCPITIAGVTGFDWASNVITGQNSPITINPSGAVPSTDLNFTGGSWKYGTGAFLTFNGGTPVADNITVSSGTHMNSNTEVAASFTNAPTNYFNLGPTLPGLGSPLLTFSIPARAPERRARARFSPVEHNGGRAGS